jgi:hypothetical protein
MRYWKISGYNSVPASDDVTSETQGHKQLAHVGFKICPAKENVNFGYECCDLNVYQNMRLC